MATTKKKTPKKITKTKVYNPLLCCIDSSHHSGARTRHLSITTKYGKPLCGEYGYSWSTSTAKKEHQRPICKKCLKIVNNLHEALMLDPGYVDLDDKLASQKEDFLAMLAEYE